MKTLLALLCLAICVACNSCSVHAAPEKLGRQSVIRLAAGNNATTRALLWLPDDYGQRPDKYYPLMIFLHGAGQGSSDSIEDLLQTGLPGLIANGLVPYGIDSITGDTVKYIVVSPHAAKSHWSFQYGQVKWMLPDLEAEYRVDTDRIFISGISAGGYGTWTCITDDSAFVRDKLTGIVPVSAAEVEANREPSILNLARYKIALWAVCGTKDAHYAGALRYDSLIRNARPLIPNHLVSIEGAGHDSSSWDPPYMLDYHGFGGKNLWTRLLDYNRSKDNDQVSIFTRGHSCAGVRRFITPREGGSYINGNSFTYQPGDTLVLTTQYNPWAYFALENIHGTPECPVVVINAGGQVKVSAMAAANCTYVKFTGSGSNDRYGFYMSSPTGSGTAYDINSRSAYIEVERSDIYHETYGAWIKQEASCADSLQYPNWRLHDIVFHDNKMVNIGQDCIYAGSTSPNGLRQINCNGIAKNPIPLRMANIKIYNNIIDSVGRTGIQLSGADSGANEIYHNRITRCGFEKNPNQGNGISLGGYTQAYVHDNDIRETFLNGIFSLGSGLVRIEHNNIDRSGYLGSISNPGVAGIMVDTRLTRPVRNTRFIIRNNGIGAFTDVAIRVYRSFPTYEKGNIISNNNSSSIKVEPGIDWGSR